MEKLEKFFRYDNVGMLFVLPAFLYMLIFVGYPIIRNLILSFQDVNTGNLVRLHGFMSGVSICHWFRAGAFKLGKIMFFQRRTFAFGRVLQKPQGCA